MGRRHVVLVGLSGSGKTTVGRLAAAALGATFVDVDAEVERLAGKDIRRIFAEDGEAAFRSLERARARDALAGPPAVLATGGGYVEDEANRSAARRSGLVIYLHAAVETAASRLARTGDRPLLDGAEAVVRLRALLARRERGYLEAEHTVVTDGKTPAALADEVASLARRHAGW